MRQRKSDDAIENSTLGTQLGRLIVAYALFAAVWLISLSEVAKAALTMSAGTLVFFSALLGLPHTILSAQRAHVRRADSLRHWRQGSWWHSFLSGAALRPIIRLTLATVLLFGLIIHLAIEPELLGFLLATAVVLPVGVWVAGRSMRPSLKPPWFSFWSIWLGAGLTAALVLAGNMLLGSPPLDSQPTLEAIRAKYPCYEGSSWSEPRSSSS